MGDFDFGQFKEIYDYLIDKMNDGDALTPQEQQAYDMLIGFSNQGLDLTNTADFNSLYTAFNGLADEGTKQEFEKLYGKDFTQGENGQVSFTQPGSIIEAFQRRGLSVNDGPAMAALTQGLKDYMGQIAQNKFASMTNSYSAMTPIRGQNIQAATNAGNIGSTAAGRRVSLAGSAMGGARGGSGEGGGGEGEPINVPVPPRPDQPSILERLAPDLIKLLGGGLVAGGGALFKDWLNNKNKGTKSDELDPNAEERPPGWQGNEIDSQPPANMGSLRMTDPYTIDQGAFTGQDPQQMNPYGAWPDAQDASGSYSAPQYSPPNYYEQPQQQQDWYYQPQQQQQQDYYSDPWSQPEDSWYSDPWAGYSDSSYDSGGWDTTYYGDDGSSWF